MEYKNIYQELEEYIDELLNVDKTTKKLIKKANRIKRLFKEEQKYNRIYENKEI